MDRIWCGRVLVALLAVGVCLGACSAVGGRVGAGAVGSRTNEPQRVFEAAGCRVVVDAGTRTVSVDGADLGEARRVVDASVLEGYLFVAQRDGVVLVYELPEPQTDGVPALVQTLDNLGRELRSIVTATDAGRVLLLSAGTTEIFGVLVHDRELVDTGEVDAPAYVDHARYLDFIRDDAGRAADARTMAPGGQRLVLVTDTELLGLVHLDRSYRVETRVALPDGVARADAIVHDGTRWILAGLSDGAEPVLMAADAIDGAWADLGVMVLDHALKGKDGPIAWLPGGFAVEGDRVCLAIRGERGAVVSWPAGAGRLTHAAVEVRWLDEPAR